MKKIILTILIMALFEITYCKITYVDFYDKEFERYVREYMFVGVNNASHMLLDKRDEAISGPILRKEIENIKGLYIDLYEYDIKDLRDIKRFKNLNNFFLAYLPGKGIKERADIPLNFNLITKLKKLERLNLCSLNLYEGSLNKEVVTVNRFEMNRCLIGESDFEEKFPHTQFLILDDNIITSFEFLSSMKELKKLLLINNMYMDTLQSLTLASSLEDIVIYSDTSEVFDFLPEVPTVKELSLRGEAGPKSEEAEKYFQWESLERLELERVTFEKTNGKWVEADRR